MVQATKELLLGFDLNEEYAQMTYYHQSVKEPLTLDYDGGNRQSLIPMGLRLDANGLWHLWDGVSREGEPEDRFRISGLYGKIDQGESLGEEFGPEELLAEYFAACMAQLKLLTENAQLRVMVTVRELSERIGGLLTAAWERNGVDRKRIFVQDYLSSFYYYAVNQKRELWSQDVALLTWEKGAVVGYVLHIDRTTRPAVARVDRVARQPMGEEVRAGREGREWDRERDRLFFELLKKVFERRNVTVSYLVGDDFNKNWAERSLQFLCCRRHAFQGQNLFSKGACYAAMERAGLTPDRGILFSGRDMIRENLGMEMRIRGKAAYYPLVSAGVNWYEAHHVCECIPDGERELRITSSPMEEGETVTHILRFTGLPLRPDRATRLRLTVYFTSPVCCRIEVEDLGFGAFYKPSGLTWKRELRF